MAGAAAERRLVVTLAAAVEGGLIGLAWLLGWALHQPPLAFFDFDAAAALRGLLAAVPPLLVAAACLRWPVGPLRQVKRFTEEVLRPLLAPCTLLDLLGIAVLAGLGEEMLFRGVLQPALGRGLGGPWLGVAAAAVLFGLLHAVTAAYAVLAAFMGAYLGWLFLGGNLLVPVVAHAAYDFVLLLYLIYGVGREPRADEGGPPEPEG
jgi:membrane protease YdiL (CAAX protease family)